MQSIISEYLGWLFQPFFRWWWAVVSGTASIVALLGTPPSGITLSNITAAIMVLFVSALVFLTFSVLVQGWSLYWDRNRRLEIVSIRRARDFGADWIFVMRGYLQASIGALVEIRRPLEGTEVPFAIVRVVETTEKGDHQAVPIWISPGHQRDFMNHKFAPRTLRAKTTLTYDRVSEAFSE